MLLPHDLNTLINFLRVMQKKIYAYIQLFARSPYTIAINRKYQIKITSKSGHDWRWLIVLNCVEIDIESKKEKMANDLFFFAGNFAKKCP